MSNLHYLSHWFPSIGYAYSWVQPYVHSFSVAYGNEIISEQLWTQIFLASNTWYEKSSSHEESQYLVLLLNSIYDPSSDITPVWY